MSNKTLTIVATVATLVMLYYAWRDHASGAGCNCSGSSSTPYRDWQ